MAVEITMPRLSDSMEEGTVVKWRLPVGASVARGQVLVEIDTDKATMEYEAETDGTLLEIIVGEGETAPIGAPIARLGTADEPLAREARGAGAPSVGAKPGRVNASPVARRLAGELGVDLAALTGSGPGGQVTKDDVQAAAEAARATAATQATAPVAAAGAAPATDASPRGRVTLEQPTRVQQVIASRMVEGAAVPSFAVETEIDVTAALALRRRLASDREPAPSLNDLVVKAAALTLRELPRFNASYTERGFELYSRVNVGVAVAADDSLLVPVVRDADRKPLAQIAAETRALAAKVRDRTIGAAELDGGTFTVSNLGMLGVTRFTPIVNPPQAAILGVGAAVRRATFPVEGGVGPAEVLTATLVSDHRIVYGADAARFLARLRELLEAPERLLES